MGGAEALLVDLIRGLGFERYEHHVIYFHDGPRKQDLHALGVATYQIHGTFFRYDPTVFIQAKRLVQKIEPSVIHAALWAGCWLGRALSKWFDIPVVCVVHLPLNSDGTIRNLLDGWTWRWATQVIGVSEQVGASVRHKVLAERIRVIPNGIDAAAIRLKGSQLTVTREQLGLTADHLVFGCVGRFVPHKRQDLLIRAFAHLIKEVPQARLLLLGVGPQEGALRHLVEELGLEESVSIIVGQPAVGYYPIFDVFVLPSVLEGLSIALLEALCFGLPAIVTGDGGHEVVQDGKQGYVIPADNQIALQDAMRKLVPQKVRSTLGLRAQELVEKQFSFETMLSSYDQLFSRFGSEKMT
jgi:glycosyltransferase involved in cell wall biosynthesis